MTGRCTLSPEQAQKAHDLIKYMMDVVGELDTQQKAVAGIGAKLIRSIEGDDVCDIMKPALELQRISNELVKRANSSWEEFDLDSVEGWDY